MKKIFRIFLRRDRLENTWPVMQSGMSPTLVLRLGCRVVRTIRKVEDGGDAKWNVQWVQEGYVGTYSCTTIELDVD